MTAASLASAPTSQSTSATTSTTGTPHSSLSPDTTYTRYADKLEDVQQQPQLELEEDHDGRQREEDVDDVSTTTLESLQTESLMNVHDAEMLITQGEAAATATATGSLDLFTSRINMVGDWAMSRLPLTSSSSYSSAASLSSTSTSDSGSTAGTVKKSPLSEAGVWPLGVLIDASRETSTSSSSSDTTVQGRIPWEAKGKKKEDATPPVVSSREEVNVRLRRNQAAPRTRRKSMTEKRRVVPIYHEPGFSRDFLLIVAMCFGLACAIILIVRPAFLRISSHGIDDYDFYDQ